MILSPVVSEFFHDGQRQIKKLIYVFPSFAKAPSILKKTHLIFFPFPLIKCKNNEYILWLWNMANRLEGRTQTEGT